MRELMNRLAHEALALADSNIELLEIEESGTKVAALQGAIAGFRELVELVEKHFALFPGAAEAERRAGARIPALLDLSDSDFLLFAAQAFLLKGDPAPEEWTAFTEAFAEAVERMKSFLLFSAEKGRDLGYTQARYKALGYFRDYLAAIEEEEKRRKKAAEEAAREEAESLDFGDEDEEGVS